MSNTPHNVYTVVNTGDSGTGSLRDALANASADINSNATAGDGGYFDEVTFAPALAGQTITLTSTLEVGSGVILDGTAGGASNVTVSGNSAVTVFTVPGTAAPDGTNLATIQNLTIAGGFGIGSKGAGGSSSSPNGGNGGDAAGGIFLQGGHLSVSNDQFSNDQATGGGGGTGSFPIGKGAGASGAGGNGGNAAGAVYVEPGATVDYAAGLTVDSNTTAMGGFEGIGEAGDGTTGTGYPISNDATITSNTICYTSGTLIRTARGDVPVEKLAVGDTVVTASGAHRPIRWLGHRAVDCRRHPCPHDAMPLRVAAHAFGPGLPARDLYLSPGHPVLVGADADHEGGHLVPVMCLINGTTIKRAAVAEVTYWHVELDAHDILLAEGLPAESYIDLGSRPWFDGADGALYDPDMAAPGMPGRCRPVVIDGPIVEAERRRLGRVFATRITAACAWPIAGDQPLLTA